MDEIAILMAAGMGTRMRPLTKKTPKPLIRVNGKPMIETVIEGLLKRHVEKIYVVTGYLKEQFEYLQKRYSEVELIYNCDYSVKNNISSIYAARNVLGKKDCFICESDIYVADDSVFMKTLDGSCYYGRMQEGYSDDWIFEITEGRISRIKKGGNCNYNMVGIAYFKKGDADILRQRIEEAYTDENNAQLFWDDIVDRNLTEICLTVEPVQVGQLVEIDTVEELERINESINVIERDKKDRD